MKFIADFHIHSKYSRATSREMDVDNIYKWAKIKGIGVVGTGDFTHPEWLKELKGKLEPAEPGLYKARKDRIKINSSNNFHSLGEDGPRFILTAEISSIYSKNNRVYKIHNLIFAPNFNVVDKINAHLGWIGNLKSDGRPILGLDVKELLKIVLSCSSECLLVPGHIWTPWFSLFGSNSGFDSIEGCFEGYSKYIYAVETGLSSDLKMNWRLSALDKIALISNSDAHSASRLGREANIFDTELDYIRIIDAIKSKDPKRFLGTIEFFPEEGKYHYDGHRNCKVRFSPEETKKHKGICPKCGRPLTLGVMYRVDQLADRELGFKPEKAVSYKNLIPLEEIIAEALGIGVNTKGVRKEYENLINHFGNEFKVLLEIQRGELESISLPEVAEAVMRIKEGKVKINPGYDGEYGEISIFNEEERENFSKQTSLF